MSFPDPQVHDFPEWVLFEEYFYYSKDIVSFGDALTVELPAKSMDMYREMERKMFLELEHDLKVHEVEAVHAASRTNKCLQIAAGFVYNAEREAIPIHEEKLDALTASDPLLDAAVRALDLELRD